MLEFEEAGRFYSPVVAAMVRPHPAATAGWSPSHRGRYPVVWQSLVPHLNLVVQKQDIRNVDKIPLKGWM